MPLPMLPLPSQRIKCYGGQEQLHEFVSQCHVLVCLLPLVWLARVPLPRRAGTGETDWAAVGHIAVAGLLMQWGYLAGVWAAVKLGMPAGMTALIVGMQPILTALYVSMRGERVSRRQWAGLLCGIAGVGLVVANKLHLAGVGATTLALCVGALLSITVGTLYQKRHCPVFDLRMGACIQFGASALLCLPFMFLFETREVHWTLPMIGSLVWSVLALSLGAIEDKSAIEPLKKALDHKEAATRFDIAYALAELGDARGREYLVQGLSEQDRAWDAVTALAWLGAASASESSRMTRPCFTNATRSHVASTSPSKCEFRNTVVPAARSSSMIPRTSSRPSGSRPEVGSSRNTSSGVLMSACASPARCIMPLLYVRRGRSAASTRSTRASSPSTRAASAAPLRPKKRP